MRSPVAMSGLVGGVDSLVAKLSESSRDLAELVRAGAVGIAGTTGTAGTAGIAGPPLGRSGALYESMLVV